MIKVINGIKAVKRRLRGVIFKYGCKVFYPKHTSIGKGTISDAKIHLMMYKHGSLIIGDQLSVRRRLELRCSGKITIGKGCFFNNDCSITAMKSVKIGDHCVFGESVKIYDHNHRFNESGRLIVQQGFKADEVIIGSNVWIGSHVTILKGVHIGDNCVIGANCVIAQSISANTVVKMCAGNLEMSSISYR